MAADKHIIKKAIVEIHVPSALSASELQSKALAFFKEKICPIIEKIVEKYSVEGETIRIERLELDLKNFKPDNTSDAILFELEQEIEKKIIKLISEERESDFSGEIITAVKKIPKEAADEELFLHLLKTGTLPWWAKTDVPVTMELLAQKLLAQPKETFIKQLSAIIRIPEVRKRIVHRLSQASTEKIISLVCTESSEVYKNISEIINIINKISDIGNLQKLLASVHEFVLKFPSSAGTSRELFFSSLIKEKNDLIFVEQLYKISNALDPDENVVMIKRALAATDKHFSGKVYELFDTEERNVFFDRDKKFLTSEKQKEEQEKQKQKLEKQKQSIEDEKAEFEKKNKTDSEKKKKTDLEKKKKDHLLKKKKQKDYSDEEKKIAPGEKSDDFLTEKKQEETATHFIDEIPETGDYYIKNSGVIIVAPYLSALFKELGLYDGKIFVSDEAKERAVFLVQYLVTGSEEPFEEHDMVLNKVLCGLEVTSPLTLQFVISENEKEECLGLLNAVAGNWSALRGTSGEGVRDAFFMRDGILEQQTNGWNLKIERTTIDILLDKLPWGISILQMPWSKEMIFVTW